MEEFKTPSLEELQQQHWDDLKSRLNPLERTQNYDILKVNSRVNAGMFHLLHENLRFLADQLFPDTAGGDYLDAHWAWRTQIRKNGTHAIGSLRLTGRPGLFIPQGTSWGQGEKVYLSETGVALDDQGAGTVQVRALEAGTAGNLPEGQTLRLSLMQAGLDDEAISQGIEGGSDRESDNDFRMRMIDSLRSGFRYGKAGDWAAWALDSCAEVLKAWEFPLSDVDGTLLIQVLGKDNAPIANLQKVQDYIKSQAPPALWTVESPRDKVFNITLNMLNPSEGNAENRRTVEAALRAWLESQGRPGMALPSGLISAVASAASPAITYVGAALPDDLCFTIRDFPVLGEVRWD